MEGEGYAVGFYNYVGPTPPVDPTNPPVQPTEHHDVGEDVTLYFSNNKGWSNVNAYVWNTTTGAKNAEWPGLSATLVGKNSLGEDVYSVSVNTGTYDMVIFNGSGGQTADISIADAVTGGSGIYCLNTTSGSGFEVAFYEYTGLGGGDTEPTQGGDTPQPGNKIYLDPGSNWPQDGARNRSRRIYKRHLLPHESCHY